MGNKPALFSGLALFLCFCMLTGARKLELIMDGSQLLIAVLIMRLLAFLLPLLLLKLALKSEVDIKLRLFLKISSFSVLGLAIFSGIALAILSFLIKYALVGFSAANPDAITGLTLQVMEDTSAKLTVISAVAIFTPIFVELFLRGALFSAHEKVAGTRACILLSGLSFALLCSQWENIPGIFFGGCLFAYLTYLSDCIWPAILAHVTYNLSSLAFTWLTDTYSVFGIWKPLPYVSILVLLAFSYLALRSLETLMITERTQYFIKSEGKGAFSIIFSPGFLVFFIAFIAGTALHVY